MLLCGVKTPFLQQDFKTTLHTHLLIHTIQTPDLFTTSLPTLLVSDQNTQVHRHHFFRFLNQTYKVNPDLFIIQDPFHQITKPITIPKPVKLKIKINIELLPIWTDFSINYMSNLRLLARLVSCLLTPIIGMPLLVMISKPFALIILGVLVILLSIVGY